MIFSNFRVPLNFSTVHGCPSSMDLKDKEGTRHLIMIPPSGKIQRQEIMDLPSKFQKAPENLSPPSQHTDDDEGHPRAGIGHHTKIATPPEMIPSETYKAIIDARLPFTEIHFGINGLRDFWEKVKKIVWGRTAGFQNFSLSHT